MSKRREPVVVNVMGRWAPGVRLKNLPDANHAAREVASIQKEEGRVTADLLLERARSVSSCLHGVFEWDDERAAHEHRLAQARLVLRSLQIVTPNGEAARMYVAVDVEESRGKQYVPTVQAMKVPEWREFVMEEALNDLRSLKAKYAAFKEMAALVEDVDRIVVKFEKRAHAL